MSVLRSATAVSADWRRPLGPAAIAVATSLAAAALALAQDVPPPPRPIPIATSYELGSTLVYKSWVDARLTRKNLTPIVDDELRSFFLTLEQTHEVAVSKPPAGASGDYLARVTVTRLLADANHGFTRVRYDSAVPADAGKSNSSLIAPFTRPLERPVELLIDVKAGTVTPRARAADPAPDEAPPAQAGARTVEELVSRALEPIRPMELAMGSTWTMGSSLALRNGTRLVTTYDYQFSQYERRAGIECARFDYKVRRKIEGESKKARIEIVQSDAGGSVWFGHKLGSTVAIESWDQLTLKTSADKFSYEEERRVEARNELVRVTKDAGGSSRPDPSSKKGR